MKRMVRASSLNYTPLYHGTTLTNAIKILESNELRANISNETETYGLSTTRNKLEAYDSVAFVLNKDKLQTQFKVKPVYREGIAGLDLAEERIDRTVKPLNKYCEQIMWNDTSKSNIKLRVLRRKLVENFDNEDYLNDPSSDAYKILRICELANQLNIPVDSRFEEALNWIKKFEDRVFDTERYDQIQARRKRGSN